MDAKMHEKASQIIKTKGGVNFGDASFGVIDESGYPSVSTVSLVKPENISELHFLTNIGGNKEKRVKKNNKASICCCFDFNNITLVGEAEALIDQETKSKYWQDRFSQMGFSGETDSNFCVIKFTTKRVSLFIDFEGAEFMVG